MAVRSLPPARALLRSAWVRLAVQVLVGVALVAALASLGSGSLLAALADADPLLLAAAVALTFAYTFLLSERWRLILRWMGYPLRPWPAFDLTMRSYFFGTFLPSNAGGDVVKAYLVSRRAIPLGVAILSAAVDRVAGLVALLWLGVPAGLLAPGLQGIIGQVSTLGLLGLAIAVTAAGAGGPRLVGLLERPAQALSPAFARSLVAGGLGALRAFGARPLLFVTATVVSVPLHAAYTASIYLVALALHAQVDPLRLLAAVVWGTLAGALPISFGGFGPREAAFAAALGSADLGVQLGLLAGVLQIVSGLPGGVLQLLDRAPAADTDAAAALPGALSPERP